MITCNVVEFFVPGDPAPGGSKKAMQHSKTGKIIVIDSAGKKNSSWKDSVAWCARKAYQGSPLSGPIEIEFIFFQRRPKNHFGTGKNSGRLKPSSPFLKTTKPDALKLARSTEDALSGIIYRDDAQIVIERISKVYSDNPGVLIKVEELSEERIDSYRSYYDGKQRYVQGLF